MQPAGHYVALALDERMSEWRPPSWFPKRLLFCVKINSSSNIQTRVEDLNESVVCFHMKLDLICTKNQNLQKYARQRIKNKEQVWSKPWLQDQWSIMHVLVASTTLISMKPSSKKIYFEHYSAVHFCTTHHSFLMPFDLGSIFLGSVNF